MDGGFENCLRLHGLRHEHREAQHGGGGGGDDGANPHPIYREGVCNHTGHSHGVGLLF